ncbi:MULTISPECIES: hypothetical protein [Acinetobacter]|uniref:hypothetical protein n=1 Tax=Acinetobacter TaxID=469 RepID=UPI0015D1F0B5|nr:MULTISPECIES: hypothetical protein [Acinetobacter]MDM1302036.1 hypothetical protein [Acinetobacter indicus]
MKRLFLSAVLGLGVTVAHAYVDLSPVMNHGNVSTAHGVNRSGLFLRCNLLETGVGAWGRQFSNVIGTWDFAPYQTRVFTIPNNTNYYSFYCVPL